MKNLIPMLKEVNNLGKKEVDYGYRDVSIPTKFKLGQKVWFVGHNQYVGPHIRQDVIKDIRIEICSLGQRIIYDLSSTTCSFREDELFTELSDAGAAYIKEVEEH